MEAHIWKESTVSEGQYNGYMTFLQGYRCSKCSGIIFMPNGMKPGDYQPPCKGSENVLRSDSKEKWKHPIKGKQKGGSQ